MPVLIIVNTLIFCALAVLHIHWAFGGKHFSRGVFPTKPGRPSVFKPNPLLTLLVAIGLIFFALITVGSTGIFDHVINRKYVGAATYIIAAIFFLRAMGDFKFVGFTKKIKGTDFADRDTKIYAPVSLIISLISFAIAYFIKYKT